MRILIGMSGGIDSTYAAFLLKEQGHEVVGASVKMHQYTDCQAAKLSCEEVGIPFVEIDGTKEFEENVITPFCQNYLNGKTPNPCIFCNPNVKIGLLTKYAKDNGFDKVATGHYSNIIKINNRYCVCAGEDPKKDQSYVLCRLTQEQLELMYLPLAALNKEEIKEKAKDFSAANSKESQEICFIPDNNYIGFITNRYGKMKSGEIISPEGNVCGKHNGILGYTIGQRKHLGVALGRPVFVSKIDTKKNQIILADVGGEYSNKASINSLVFQLLEEKDNKIDAFVKTRYSSKLTSATIDIIAKERIATIEFHEDVRAITPGQSAVIYDEHKHVLLSGYFE